MTLYCLNPKLHRGHPNQDYVMRCQECDFLVKGAQIDHYEIIDFLGSGGFGAVYSVKEPEPLGRIFALKILHASHSTDSLVKRFSQEAANIAKLQQQSSQWTARRCETLVLQRCSQR